MNKFEAFGYFLTQKPIIVLSIISQFLLLSFAITIFSEPLYISFVGKVYINVPLWIQCLCFIILPVKNMHLVYIKFEKWCKIQNFF